jgi:hypothetical protein
MMGPGYGLLGGFLGGTTNTGDQRMLNALAQHITTTTGTGITVNAGDLNMLDTFPAHLAPKTIREELQQETDDWLDGVL